MPGRPPLILDFDSSVTTLDPGEIRIPLNDWQERIRFGCSRRALRQLRQYLSPLMPPEYGPVFIGSGDYHHVTLLLLHTLAFRRSLPPASLDLIVCDNHPDNMRYLFGLHCGSWVRHAARLPFIRSIHVLGICSPDITTPHAWENYLTPFLTRKLHYWSINKNAPWLALLQRRDHIHSFATSDELIRNFLPLLGAFPHLYLSIDKDSLSPATLLTGWDQGLFTPEHLAILIRACAGKLLAADITGENSPYNYATPLKKLLTRLDRRPHHQPQPHTRLNARLLQLLQDSLMLFIPK